MSFFPKHHASRPGTIQTITVGASSTAAASKFGAETYQIRLAANTACLYAIGDGSAPTASQSSVFLPANQIEYVIVSPGQFISAIEASTGGLVTGTAGTLWITEMS